MAKPKPTNLPPIFRQYARYRGQTCYECHTAIVPPNAFWLREIPARRAFCDDCGSIEALEYKIVDLTEEKA